MEDQEDTDISRNVDNVQASADPVALNNLIVRMRPIMKKAKLFAVENLFRKAQQLRKKAGSDQQKAKNERKAERFVAQANSIKEIKADKASKFAFYNTELLQDAKDQEIINLIRLTSHKAVQQEVAKFRKEHEDWRSLAAFMMSKNTSRNYKKKKPGGSKTSSKSDAKDSVSASKEKKPKKELNDRKEQEKNVNKSVKQVKSNNENDQNVEFSGDEDSAESSEDEGSAESDGNVDDGQSDGEEIEHTNLKTESPCQPSEKVLDKPHRQHEMVVKKLNIENLDSDLRELNESSVFVGKLNDENSANDLKKKRKKDSFFITGNSDDEGDTESDEAASDSGQSDVSEDIASSKTSFNNLSATRRNHNQKEFNHDQLPKEKLHPSWEASKRRKLEQSKIQMYQGKKTTFDD